MSSIIPYIRVSKCVVHILTSAGKMGNRGAECISEEHSERCLSAPMVDNYYNVTEIKMAESEPP